MSKVELIKLKDRFALQRDDGLLVAIDFINDKAQYHRRMGSPAKELIARACGWSAGCRSVLDLTAGFAVDAVMLARIGFKVTALERNADLYKLLESAWNADHGELSWQIRFLNSEAETYLNSLLETHQPQVIYYDPMYPQKEKSALPPKNMQMLQDLIGKDEANAEILRLALTKAKDRVVVKRPIAAPPILTPVHQVLEGKMVRYDIYLVRRVSKVPARKI